LEIRRLVESDWEAYRALRLEGLAGAPEAFGSDVEVEQQRPDEHWIGRLGPNPNSFLLGAWVDGRLVGMAGFIREEGRKERHKGMIVSVYVTPSHRKGGTGRRLMAQALDDARLLEGLVQICLSVGDRNEPARRLYESLGFVTYGVEPRGLRVGEKYVTERHMLLHLDGYREE
jgi:GNAT superfamily N-acetyltransferase